MFYDQTKAKLSFTANNSKCTGYQFRCALTANGVTVYSKAATLTRVYPGLSITPDPASGNHTEHRYIKIGDSFTLECFVKGGSSDVYHYKWFCGTQVIEEGEAAEGRIAITDEAGNKTVVSVDPTTGLVI